MSGRVSLASKRGKHNVSTAAITSTPTSGTRSDFTAAVGTRITVGGTDLTVTDVGRWKNTGNSLTHVVKLVDAATGIDVPGGSAVVDLSGGSVGSYVYAALAGAVTLLAGQDYYLLTAELNGGDTWRDLEAVTPSADLSIVNGAYYDGSFHDTGAGQAYGPPNFLYTTGGGGPPIAVLSQFANTMRRNS